MLEVVPPDVIGVKISLIANNSPTTSTVTVAVAQFAGFAPLSQIVYVIG
ncbi:hypothetical protein [Tenacibaculum piscium]|nr:hypothetical protein [Tenacibaculum piscium]